ncbi:VCBS repeat-containing protein [bacterium]|nr:VCBS repeat-containing protein [bacterium]
MTSKILAIFTLFGCINSQGQSRGGKQHADRPIASEEQSVSHFTSLDLDSAPAGSDGFRLISGTETGIVFTNRLNTDFSANAFNLLNGSGVTLGDYDGDGWCDVFLVAMSGHNKLFRNRGNWQFEETTESAGFKKTVPYSSGAVFEDINGDGWLDLLVSTFGSGIRTYINLGNGRFTPLKNPKLESPYGSATLALSDVDGDGDLDLYVTNYGLHTMRTKLDLRIRTVRGKPQVVGRYRDYYKIIGGKLVEYGEPDVLFLNDGRGVFQPVSWTDGSFLDEEGQALSHGYRDLGLSAMFRDINQDGLPDLYVCNDFQTPDRLWINQGSGKFRAISREAIKVSSYSSMGVDFGDLNRDGNDDFMVVDMLSRTHRLRMTQHVESAPPIQTTGELNWDRPQLSRNTVYVNEGDASFTEVAQYAGLSATEWSWSPVFMDVDLDGFEDILIGNGHAQDNLDMDTLQKRSQFPNDSPQQLAITFPELKTPNLAYRNLGHMRFEEVGAKWGFDTTQVSNAIALGDLDNDGDLDVIVNCLNAPALVFENKSTKPRIGIRLKGRSGNPRGIGARISLVEGDFVQNQEMISGGRYLSGDQAQRTFAITKPNIKRKLKIRWRSGAISWIDDVQANRMYEITEPSTPIQTRSRDKQKIQPSTLFRKSTAISQPHHSTTGPDSRQRQSTWPINRSTLGSSVAWIDMDGDGDEDLAVSGGSQASVWFENQGNGLFAASQERHGKTARWADSGFASIPISGTQGLIIIPQQTNHTLPNTLIHWMPDGSEKAVAKLPSSQYGPLAVADVDSDGDLDIFAGGQSPWGGFPISTGSLLLVNDKGGFKNDVNNEDALQHLQNVRGALFTDWDLDGDPDLITANEWGGITWLINDQGTFKNQSLEIGLKNFNGLWQGLASGDFNEDGRPDLIVCNIGQNTHWSQWMTDRFRIYYSAKISPPETIILRAYHDGNQWLPISSMQDLLPWIHEGRARFKDHEAYASMNITEILGGQASKFEYKEINTLETVVLLNLPAGVKKVDVNPIAQWAPAYGPVVVDFNNDGHEDVFLSQNMDTGNRQWGRMDSGHGLLLLGDGKGNFSPVHHTKSGIQLTGEQRGTAIADFNQDGKADLAILERGKGAYIFTNQSENHGVNIILKGSSNNPDCIGAKLRLLDVISGSKIGPLKEVQSGTGYRSLNSLKPIFALQENSHRIEITWPGGKTSTHSIPKGVTQLTIQQP